MLSLRPLQRIGRTLFILLPSMALSEGSDLYSLSKVSECPVYVRLPSKFLQRKLQAICYRVGQIGRRIVHGRAADKINGLRVCFFHEAVNSGLSAPNVADQSIEQGAVFGGGSCLSPKLRPAEISLRSIAFISVTQTTRVEGTQLFCRSARSADEMGITSRLWFIETNAACCLVQETLAWTATLCAGRFDRSEPSCRRLGELHCHRGGVDVPPINPDSERACFAAEDC